MYNPVGASIARPCDNVGADAHIRPRYVVESLHHRSDGSPPFRQGRQPSPTLAFARACRGRHPRRPEDNVGAVSLCEKEAGICPAVSL